MLHQSPAVPAVISIREATAEDGPFVDALTRATMRAYVEATWPGYAEREHYYAINRFRPEGTAIVWAGDRRAGRITVIRTGAEILLEEIHLLPEFQGLGIGAGLIEQLLAEGRATGRPVVLWVLRTNPAQRLYGRLGFRVVEQTPERFRMRAGTGPVTN